MKNKSVFTKVLIIIMLIVNTFQFCHAETITIASWNIQKHYDDNAIMFIADFVKKEKVDILCIQEARLEFLKIEGDDVHKKLDEGRSDLITKLISYLNSKTNAKWGYITSAEYAIRKKQYDYLECAAGLDNIIFYNKNKLKVKDESGKFKLGNFSETPQDYRTDKNNIQIVKFTNNTGNSFNLINVHLPFNERELTDEVFKQYINCFYRDFHILYNFFHNLTMKRTIICGDFNFPITDFNRINRTSKTNFVESDFYVKDATTVYGTDFSKSYDHFVFKNNFEYKIVLKPKRAATKSTDGQIAIGTSETKSKKFDFKEYKKNHSDHVPIIMAIDL